MIKKTLSFLDRVRKHPVVLFLISTVLVGTGVLFLWISTLRLPDLSSFEQRRVAQSTKIYDRAGEVVLYDVFGSAQRTVVPFGDISRNIKNATVAIEDDTFYEHRGVRPVAFLRAALINLITGTYSQGGSTITQQVVKNTLLTKEKKISRKIKEWVIAIKLEQILSKEEILAAYLNETPYGGNIYGVEEASLRFFGKSAKDLSVAESAYVAAIPQATTYYSPYGKNLKALEDRKNTVLKKMSDLGFITKEEYGGAVKEVVNFKPQEQYGIKAPHFVLYIKEELEKMFGAETVLSGGLKIITSLDYVLQEKAEEIVKKYSVINEKNFDAKNAALVALDPKNGDILVMVGSRDYFDKEIEGNYNVVTGGAGGRQPGSSFKPIVYAQAFLEGYTPETVLFDLPTEFSSLCDMESRPLKIGSDPKKVCYSPVNYDDKFRGPISLRGALAQSINVPSVKLLYLVGIKDALGLAKTLGLSTLSNKDQYGLTLVLGGGEVTPLELTRAYSTFANDGIYTNSGGILKVEDVKGKVLFEKKPGGFRALPENVARTVSNILSDNNARLPAYGPTSALYFPGFDVAVKTGTTNDYRDAWTIGYTPFISIGAWVGNNDNSSMQKKVAGQIVAPMWNEFMKFAIANHPTKENFKKPSPPTTDLKPVLRGIWQGGLAYEIDSVSGKLATEYTPNETRVEKIVPGVHSILYWLNKNDPYGPAPDKPEEDPQFARWEEPVRRWAFLNGYFDGTSAEIPTDVDDVHTPQNNISIKISGPEDGVIAQRGADITIGISSDNNQLVKAIVYINGSYVETIENAPFVTTISSSLLETFNGEVELRVVGYNSVFNRGEKTIIFTVK